MQKCCRQRSQCPLIPDKYADYDLLGCSVVVFAHSRFHNKQSTHGYVTGHGIQGKFVDAGVVSADGMRKGLSYVAASGFYGDRQPVIVPPGAPQSLPSILPSAKLTTVTEWFPAEN